MRTQEAVPELVWCPANIMEMNMPVISSAVKRGLPSSSLIMISTSSMSRWLLSVGGLAIRLFMISWTSATKPARAASRCRKLSISRYGST
ncbi:Uncharacterised protein [Mycobacteroides abscessus subsp. massiliense]|nr:Uncharacterised protein [Mycobacteroides abscessus subsp. massiliense]